VQPADQPTRTHPASSWWWRRSPWRWWGPETAPNRDPRNPRRVPCWSPTCPHPPVLAPEPPERGAKTCSTHALHRGRPAAAARPGEAGIAAPTLGTEAVPPQSPCQVPTSPPVSLSRVEARSALEAAGGCAADPSAVGGRIAPGARATCFRGHPLHRHLAPLKRAPLKGGALRAAKRDPPFGSPRSRITPPGGRRHLQDAVVGVGWPARDHR